MLTHKPLFQTKRYEYHGWTNNGNPSHKYWEIKENAYGWNASWGKVGTKQGTKFYSDAEIGKKIREKLNKGYREIG